MWLCVYAAVCVGYVCGYMCVGCVYHCVYVGCVCGVCLCLCVYVGCVCGCVCVWQILTSAETAVQVMEVFCSAMKQIVFLPIPWTLPDL